MNERCPSQNLDFIERWSQSQCVSHHKTLKRPIHVLDLVFFPPFSSWRQTVLTTQNGHSQLNKCGSGEIMSKAFSSWKVKKRPKPELLSFNHNKGNSHLAQPYLPIITVSMPLFELLVGPSRTQLQAHLTDVHHERRSRKVFFFFSFCANNMR